MKAAPFDYVVPGSIAEAVDHLADAGGDANVLAGGQTLVPLLALRMATPTLLVDVNSIAALSEISRTATGTRIGATVRQNRVLTDPVIATHVPVLPRATAFVGHHQTRNRGTIGGSVALGEPAAEYPATIVALGATIEAQSQRGTRHIPAHDFYLGPYTTALEPDELITAIQIPDWPPGTITLVHEVTRRPGDFALVGLVALFAVDAARITRAGIAWFGMGPQPLRSAAAEAALAGASFADIDFAGLAQLALSDTDPMDDAQATAAYRRTVGARIFERLTRAALGTRRAA